MEKPKYFYLKGLYADVYYRFGNGEVLVISKSRSIRKVLTLPSIMADKFEIITEEEFTTKLNEVKAFLDS